jgi:hypothetical protein
MKNLKPIEVPPEVMNDADAKGCPFSWLMLMQQGMGGVQQTPMMMPCVGESCALWSDPKQMCGLAVVTLVNEQHSAAPIDAPKPVPTAAPGEAQAPESPIVTP